MIGYKSYFNKLNNKAKRCLGVILLVILLPPVISIVWDQKGYSTHTSSRQGGGINGTYVYQDEVSKSVVSISNSHWTMKTQFGAPGYYGNPEYESGEVRGNILYYSGLIEYGRVSGRTLWIGERRYQKK